MACSWQNILVASDVHGALVRFGVYCSFERSTSRRATLRLSSSMDFRMSFPQTTRVNIFSIHSSAPQLRPPAPPIINDCLTLLRSAK